MAGRGLEQGRRGEDEDHLWRECEREELQGASYSKGCGWLFGRRRQSEARLCGHHQRQDLRR